MGLSQEITFETVFGLTCFNMSNLKIRGYRNKTKHFHDAVGPRVVKVLIITSTYVIYR